MSRFGVAVVVLCFPFVCLAQTLTPAHYIVCEIDRANVVTVHSIDDVMLAGELPSEVSSAAMDRRAESDRIDVVVRDVAGRVVFHSGVTPERHIRVEVARGADGTGPIDGRRIEPASVAFVVRIPRAGAETLELTPRKTQRTTRVLVSDLPRPRMRSLAMPVKSDTSPANRLDLLIMGDGYTSAQTAKFETDANNLIADFFDIPPYSTYSNYVNVTKYFVASPQSGADHPVCSEPGKNPDPLEGTFVSTAFDATYCTSSIQRLLTVSDTKVYTAAAAVANWDKIMVVVNDDMYGGAGGPVSVVSTNQYAVGVAQHEFGHSFTALADEYTSPYPGFLACSDTSGTSPCEANVTNTTARASIKWNPWIAPATPVPTMPPLSFPDDVGLFQGARYQTSGMYRPRLDCLMNNLGQPFCEICTQAYILRLYNGWGGAPASGIDMIEPGTETPAPGATTGAIGEPKTFTATLLEPAGGPAATKQWYVDSVLQGGETSNTFIWTPSSGGNHTVELKVTDATTLVNGSMAGTALQSARTWTVNVSSIAAPTNFVAAAGTSSVALSWNAVGGATSYEIVRTSGAGFAPLATVSGTSHVDSTVVPDTGYAYKVRAVGGAYTTPDLGTVFTATDEPVTTAVNVKAIHMAQLRSAINTARTAAGLGAATYSFVPGPGGVVRAADVAEMRTALNAARTALGMLPFSFTDATLTAFASPIRAAHVNELRTALR